MVPGGTGSNPPWRPKTAAERAQDVRRMRMARFHPAQALRVGAVAAAVGGGIAAAASLSAGLTSPLGGAFVGAVASAMGLAAAGLAYALQVVGWLSRPPRLRLGVCTRCFRLSTDGREDVCACGGRFEDADGWTPNRCPSCGYDLRGNAGERCPECGAGLAAALMESTTKPGPRP